MIHLGALIPATNVIVEPELYRFITTEKGTSDNIIIHFARVDFVTPYIQNSQRFLVELCKNTQAAIFRLRTIPLKGLGFFCTSATEIHDSKRYKKILDNTKVPLVTSADAIVSACTVTNIKHALLITPYDEIIGKDVSRLLHKHNIDTEREYHLNLKTSQELLKFGFNSLASTIKKNFCSHLDGVIISCTNFPTFHIIHYLEKELEIPVISSNQATLWKMLSQLRVDVPFSRKFGLLFQTKIFKD